MPATRGTPQAPQSKKWQIVEDVDNGAHKANRRNPVLGAHKQHLGTRSKSSDYQDTRLHYRERAHTSEDSSSEDTRSEVISPSYQTLLASLELPSKFKKRGTKEKGKNASACVPARKCSSPKERGSFQAMTRTFGIFFIHHTPVVSTVVRDVSLICSYKMLRTPEREAA